MLPAWNLRHPICNRRVHRLLIVPMVVAERVLIDVILQVLRAHGMVRAVYAPLQLRPEALNRVRVDAAHDIDLLAVIDALVLVFLLAV